MVKITVLLVHKQLRRQLRRAQRTVRMVLPTRRTAELMVQLPRTATTRATAMLRLKVKLKAATQTRTNNNEVAPTEEETDRDSDLLHENSFREAR